MPQLRKTRSIDVDDEVFAYLQSHAEPFVDDANAVLRRLLSLDSKASPETALDGSRHQAVPGALRVLLDAGRLIPGDILIHEQPRKRRLHKATVREDGWLVGGDGVAYAKPSPALKACVGHEINGWAYWRLQRTGQSLQDLRYPQ